jgi:hypothetical protein
MVLDSARLGMGMTSNLNTGLVLQQIETNNQEHSVSQCGLLPDIHEWHASPRVAGFEGNVIETSHHRLR